MRAIIYTVGYQSTRLEDLSRFLEERNAVVLDARFTPYSRAAPEWNGRNLGKVLGHRYQWVGEFGNKNYKGNTIEISNFEAGLVKAKHQLDKGQSIVLLCCCWDVNECHRKVVADRLSQELGFDVEHVTIKRPPPVAAPPPPPDPQTTLF